MPLRQLYPDSKSAASGDTVTVDIVAVHGLNPQSKDDADHAWDTWRTPAGPDGRLWLRDDLPKYVPNSRIFLYQYSSTAVYGKDRDTFIGKANELLEAIRIERCDVESGPILFLGHSMGGLLIKQALINAHSNPKYTLIKDATTGLAFFATPHSGGDWLVVSLGGVAAKIATAIGFQKGDDVLETLKKGSIFSDIMREHWRHQLLKYNIVSFWGALDSIVPVESARFGMPGDRENVVKLNADHSTVCKFGPSLADQDNFKLVQSNIRDLYRSALIAYATKSKQAIFKETVPSYPVSYMMPVKTFVQRPALRDSIREQLRRELDNHRKGETKKVGVWGLGGVGKSQLVRGYIQHYRADYNAVFWVQAGQPTSIERDFLQIYTLLLKAQENQSLFIDKVIQAVHNWFFERSGTWLFVFDGADQLEDERNPQFVDLDRYIPGLPSIHVIITGRSSTAGQLSTFEGVEVRELEELQAVDLFLNCVQTPTKHQQARDEATKIVKELGCLALAVSLTGTYVSQALELSSNLPAFLKDFRRRRQELLNEKPKKLIHQYRDSLMTTWETSYSAISNELPEACRLLTLLAFVNYEDIFLGLFGAYASPAPQQSWVSVIKEEGEIGKQTIENCFAKLEKYSLLQRQDEVTYSMHRLVHAWCCDRHLNKELQDRNRFCLAALNLLFSAAMVCENTPQAKLRLMPHLRTNIDAIKGLNIDKINDYEILVQMKYLGEFASGIGCLQEAAMIKREVLDINQRILGNNHPETIHAMDHLAATLKDQGMLDDAMTMMLRAYENKQETLGDDHPHTISVLANLCTILAQRGFDTEALERELLEKMQRVFGNDHISTITVMHNLSSSLDDLGKSDEAVAMKREVLKKWQRIVGDEHPHTISAMHNLAITLDRQGKIDQAAEIVVEVLGKAQRILGDEHPRTISVMDSVANILGHQGKLEEAADRHREVIEKRHRILGGEHPNTILAIGNYAATLYYQGKLGEATGLFREVVGKLARILGDEHPDTIRAKTNLAAILRDQGKLNEAVAAHRELPE
ncbi:hypothetical protein B0O99DRAFT_744603 [Bisporella sp. PMI_857]|nr:hypothetical protein B0O99DRAFT_744603 [Bisporella sp. PMI_857]